MNVSHHFDLTGFNSYRLHAICQRAFFPGSEKDFITIYEQESIQQKVLLGGGYNVILSKPFYEEDFIIIGEAFSASHIDEGNILSAEAGADVRMLSELACDHGLSGFEVFYDIPSTVGGAVVMNAGASGEEIKDVLVKVRYLDLVDMKVKEIRKEEINFEYRNSFFQRQTDKIVLKAWFRLNQGDKKVIREKMDHIKAARWAKQPKDLPNAGSVFKRPPGYFVGQIMDQLKLKGYTVGGAKVSEKHGGFIVNFDHATGHDILSVIQHVQTRVREELGVELEIEQRII